MKIKIVLYAMFVSLVLVSCTIEDEYVGNKPVSNNEEQPTPRPRPHPYPTY